MARRRQLTTRSTSPATADDTQHVTERVRFARARSGVWSASSTTSAGTAEARCAVGDLTAVVHVSGADAPDVVVVLVHGVGDRKSVV